MSTRRLSVVTLMLALAVAGVANAQEPAPVATLRGIAYDSLRSRPLPGAVITIESLGRMAFADSGGAFAFEGLPQGTYDLVLQHDYLDSLGLGEPRTSVTVPGDGRLVRVATPSFTTLWRRVCGTRPPSDSGFVHGVVRDARNGSSLPLTQVQASWVDVGFDQRTGVSEERLGGSVTTDGQGRYTICGVPNGVRLHLRARQGEASTDVIELFHVEPGITRKDFLLRAVGDSALRGVARGIVRGAAGGPAPNALLQVAEAREVRTDAQGRFVLAGALIGTRSVIVRAIGADPARAVIDVPWGDTAYVEILLRNIPTLAQVEVVGSAAQRRFLADLADRQALGVATFLDSTVMAQLNSFQSALTSRTTATMQRDGTVRFGYGPRACRPVVWIDRRYIEPRDVAAELRLVNPARVGAVEVYENAGGIPMEYHPPRFDENRETRCAIVIWTKAMFP